MSWKVYLGTGLTIAVVLAMLTVDSTPRSFPIASQSQKAEWFANGQAEGKRDIASGKLMLKRYGLLAPWVPPTNKQLKDRLGVETTMVAGCVVTEELVEEANGYNDIMLQEIERLFGKDAIRKICEDATAEYASSSITAVIVPDRQ